MKYLLIITIFLCFTGVCFSESVTVTVDSIPGNIDQFLALRDEIAATPEGGAAVFIIAMILYNEDKDLGLQAFTIALDREQLSEGNVYKGFKPYSSWYNFFEQLGYAEYLGRVYIDGTDYSDAYTLPDKPYRFVFTGRQETGENRVKVFVQTTSGNMPRPLSLVKNNRGIWKVWEASSLFVGVSKIPPDNNDDDL
jgi:hypothetical protein